MFTLIFNHTPLFVLLKYLGIHWSDFPFLPVPSWPCLLLFISYLSTSMRSTFLILQVNDISLLFWVFLRFFLSFIFLINVYLDMYCVCWGWGTHRGQKMKTGVTDSCDRNNMDFGNCTQNTVEEQNTVELLLDL